VEPSSSHAVVRVCLDRRHGSTFGCRLSKSGHPARPSRSAGSVRRCHGRTPASSWCTMPSSFGDDATGLTYGWGFVAIGPGTVHPIPGRGAGKDTRRAAPPVIHTANGRVTAGEWGFPYGDGGYAVDMAATTATPPTTDVAHVLDGCVLAFGPNDLRRCWWCGHQLLPRQRRWCSSACIRAVKVNHVWHFSRQAALSHAHGRCWCGELAVNVHHEPPIPHGQGYGPSCAHHQDRVHPLCKAHHHQMHRRRRRPGVVVQPTLFAA